MQNPSSVALASPQQPHPRLRRRLPHRKYHRAHQLGRGSHGYRDLYITETTDGAKTWSKPQRLDALLRKRHDDGIERVFGDICPQWHAKTGKLLITGGFAPVEVNETETWVISSEMAFPEARKDENNRVLLAKIVWSQP